MSALFGHKKGAFTGAAADRPGLLRAADKGMLFLDEIGELGLDEQAMILRAIEEKKFLPVGADREASSDFQLIAGTNRDLGDAVAAGRFREDLFARLNLWTFELPALARPARGYRAQPRLRARPLRRARGQQGQLQQGGAPRLPRLRHGARGDAGRAISATWRPASPAWRPSPRAAGSTSPRSRPRNARLKRLWSGGGRAVADALDGAARSGEALDALDPFDRVQLAEVVRVCRQSRSLSEAGRTLFSAVAVAPRLVERRRPPAQISPALRPRLGGLG